MNLFTLSCGECGDVLLSIQAEDAHDPIVVGNAEIFATCGACGHTARYVHVEDGTPVWRGSR